MPALDSLLQLVGVSKRFAAVGADGSLGILRDITFAVRSGESVAIAGPSGSGKSTLLNILGTLDQPSQGQVILDGEDVSKLPPDRLAALRNRKIGFIFQAHHLLPHCTVLENVLVPTLPHPESGGPAQAADRARTLLRRVGLGERLSHRPGQLSGGERQRVAVVRALINRPKLLLADEPTGALDRQSAEDLGMLLLELNREEGVTLIVVTHALDLARQLGRLLELNDGQLREMKA